MLTVTSAADERRDALAGRLFEATLGAFDLLVIHLGDRLGLYGTLADGRSRTYAELAADAGIADRYAREWLEHQAVAGILDVADATEPAESRRYVLPSGHAAVLADSTSLASMTPLAQFVVGGARSIDDLVTAHRTGRGIPWDANQDVVDAQDAINRPAFTQLLVDEWTAALPDIDARLRANGGRIADVACGTGWSTLALARGYDKARVDGLDLDAGSIATASSRLVDEPAEVAARVTFQARDAGDPGLAGQYDLAVILEAVHDMSRPVDALRAVRGLLRPDGALLVADEKVAESFVAPGDEVERIMYSYSVLFCLPNGLADQPSVGTGTVLRPNRLNEMAAMAGFSAVTVLPIEHDTFRFYRLDP